MVLNFPANLKFAKFSTYKFSSYKKKEFALQ